MLSLYEPEEDTCHWSVVGFYWFAAIHGRIFVIVCIGANHVVKYTGDRYKPKKYMHGTNSQSVCASWNSPIGCQMVSNAVCVSCAVLLIVSVPGAYQRCGKKKWIATSSVQGVLGENRFLWTLAKSLSYHLDTNILLIVDFQHYRCHVHGHFSTWKSWSALCKNIARIGFPFKLQESIPFAKS